jgi:hypothetical protein
MILELDEEGNEIGPRVFIERRMLGRGIDLGERDKYMFLMEIVEGKLRLSFGAEFATSGCGTFLTDEEVVLLEELFDEAALEREKQR